MIDIEANTTLRFDDFTLSTKPVALKKDGNPVPLQTQPLRLLILLVSRHGNVVSQEEIRAHIWEKVHVDFASSIHVCIGQIRKALGDDGSEPLYIETIPRRGYRFIGVVEQLPERRKSRVATNSMVAFVLASIALLTIVVSSNKGPGDSSTFNAAADPYPTARRLVNNRNEGSARESLRYFDRAIKADPEFAPAYAGMAQAYTLIRDYPRAREYADLAIGKDPTYAEGYLRLAMIQSASAWEWDSARANLERAIELTPARYEAHMALAKNLLVTGYPARALDEMHAALELEGAPAHKLVDFGLTLYYARDLKGAQMQCEAAASAELASGEAESCLYRVSIATRDWEAAREQSLAMMRIQAVPKATIQALAEKPARDAIRDFETDRVAQSPADPLELAFSLAVLRRYDESFYYLRQAEEQRYQDLPLTLLDPVYIPLRHQSAFAAMAEKIGVRFPQPLLSPNGLD